MTEHGPREIFAERLTLLWVAAGKPTYERLVREAKERHAGQPRSRGAVVTKQRISAWRTGKQVPRDYLGVSTVISVLVAEAKRRCPEPGAPGLYNEQVWRALWKTAAVEALGARHADTVAPARERTLSEDIEVVCPYRGLAPYRSSDSQYYFGRTRATQNVVERVEAVSLTGGLLVLVAPSGAGKSSLLAAGLAPVIREGSPTDPCIKHWSIIEMTPGADPLGTLGTSLPPTPIYSNITTLSKLSNTARKTAQHWNEEQSGSDTRLIIVVDQFEEVFTLCDEQQRTIFIDTIDAMARGPAPAAVVVVSLRADFYGRCLGYPALADAFQHRQVVLEPMTKRELTEAITGPAKAVGLRLEPHLVEMITEDATHGLAARSLPILSHALQATWQHRTHGRLTIDGYRSVGGIRGTVTQIADRALTQLNEPTRVAAMNLLLRLTRIGDDLSQNSPWRRTAADLVTESADHETTQQALESLVKSRIVRADAGSVQIIHEALLTAWPRLSNHIDRHREPLLGLQRLEDDARHWDEHGREASRLYRGNALDDALRIAGSRDLGGARASTLVTEFLHAARSDQDLRRRRDRIGRQLLIVLAVLVALGLAVGVTAAVGCGLI